MRDELDLRWCGDCYEWSNSVDELLVRHDHLVFNILVPLDLRRHLRDAPIQLLGHLLTDSGLFNRLRLFEFRLRLFLWLFWAAELYFFHYF